MARQLALGVRSAVGQRVLRLLPDALIGIELRRIARESVEVEPGMADLQRTKGFAAVDRTVVPDHDHVTAEVPKQFPQERADLRLANVVREELEVQPESSAARTHGEARDDGDPVAPLAMAKQRRVASGRPGAAHARDQEEPRFVDEDEVGAQPSGFFLICGQVLRFQSAIRSSFRSSARRSGFCTLQPIARRTRLT